MLSLYLFLLVTPSTLFVFLDSIPLPTHITSNHDVCQKNCCPLRRHICNDYNEDRCTIPHCSLRHICLFCHGDHMVTSRIHEDVLQNLYCTAYNFGKCRHPFCRTRHICLSCDRHHPAIVGTRCKIVLQNKVERRHICDDYNENRCTNSSCSQHHICFSCYGLHGHHYHKWAKTMSICPLFNETICNYAYCRLRHVCGNCYNSHRSVDNEICN